MKYTIHMGIEVTRGKLLKKKKKEKKDVCPWHVDACAHQCHDNLQ